MKNTCCIILAAGSGKRMKSYKPKVLTEVLFQPMIEWVMDTVCNCDIKDICVVTGYMSDLVKSHLSNLGYKYESALQKEQKGTAHAVLAANLFLHRHINKDILILNGDCPFVTKETILEAYNVHKFKNNSATIISSNIQNPYGYGRIVRNQRGEVSSIIEEKDANTYQKNIKEINCGAYWFKTSDLLENLYKISNHTAQHEYYLTSVIELLINNNFKVNAFKALSDEVSLGANDYSQLKLLNDIARRKILNDLILNGVNIPCFDGIVVGKKVEIGDGTLILPGTILSGRTVIGSNCVLGPNSQIIDSMVGNDVEINLSYCKNCIVSNQEKIGPFESLIDKKNLIDIKYTG